MKSHTQKFAARFYLCFYVYIVGQACGFASFSNAAGFEQTQNLDNSSQEALVNTQNLLNDRQQRERATKQGDAQKADNYVAKLTGNDQKLNDQIYGLASKVFPLLAKKAGGDPQKMTEMVEQYLKNPESFTGEWSQDELRELHDLSLKLPAPTNRN